LIAEAPSATVSAVIAAYPAVSQTFATGDA
jgi:hypothetical protein